MTYVVACIVAYLLGSIPVSVLVARRHGVDLYATADGNPGAWNALEQLGPRRAWPAFAGDAAKGLVAGLLGVALGGVWVGYAAVAAAMVGHAFPLFARLRGGKSVMTFAGGMLAVAPLPGGGRARRLRARERPRALVRPRRQGRDLRLPARAARPRPRRARARGRHGRPHVPDRGALPAQWSPSWVASWLARGSSSVARTQNMMRASGT